MVELQRCSDKGQWDEFILDAGGHPLQLWSWGQVKAGHGWVAERLFLYSDDKIVAAAQVLVRRLPLPLRSFAYIPRGPVFAPDKAERAQHSPKEVSREIMALSPEVLRAIADFVKREYKSVTLSIEPDSFSFEKPDGWVRSTNKILPAETILLDVTQSESDLLAVMAKKTRQYIRKSAAEVTVKQIKDKESIERCLDIYAETANRAGFNMHSRQYYLDVFIQMQDYSPIFGAYHKGELVAFLWMAISEATAYELYGGVTEVGQEVRANYALKWHAIRKMKEWGLKNYDFGGLVVGGVTTFKQGWAREVTLFAGSFDKPLSPLYVIWSRGLPLAKRFTQRIKRK